MSISQVIGAQGDLETPGGKILGFSRFCPCDLNSDFEQILAINYPEACTFALDMLLYALVII